MQAFCCEVVRARTKLGIAMAANRPMMATTIMISTRVKPDLLDVLIFIFCSLLSIRGVNAATGWLLLSVQFSSTNCLSQTALLFKQFKCQLPSMEPQKTKKPQLLDRAVQLAQVVDARILL